MRWAGHVAHMGEKRWEDNTKMDLKKYDWVV
jgi:hypothetical protein